MTKTQGIDGIVLRYGRLYGPGTWSATPNGAAPLHVDAAAEAAFLAMTKGAPGIYNVAEDDGAVSSEKATPLDAISERTIFITPTDRNTLKWSKPLSIR